MPCCYSHYKHIISLVPYLSGILPIGPTPSKESHQVVRCRSGLTGPTPIALTHSSPSLWQTSKTGMESCRAARALKTIQSTTSAGRSLKAGTTAGNVPQRIPSEEATQPIKRYTYTLTCLLLLTPAVLIAFLAILVISLLSCPDLVAKDSYFWIRQVVRLT